MGGMVPNMEEVRGKFETRALFGGREGGLESFQSSLEKRGDTGSEGI